MLKKLITIVSAGIVLALSAGSISASDFEASTSVGAIHVNAHRVNDGLGGTGSGGSFGSMVRTIPRIAAVTAKNLGYSPTKYISHGKKVFKKDGKGSPQYIVIDKDSHNGGVWKGASSVKNLSKKQTRSGTYDAHLNRIGD